MTEADKKLVIRNATMEDLFEVAAVEAECFPAAEAATEAEFREGLPVMADISGCSLRMSALFPL